MSVMDDCQHYLYKSKNLDDFFRILENLEFLKATRYLKYNDEKVSLTDKTKFNIMNKLE